MDAVNAFNMEVKFVRVLSSVNTKANVSAS